MGFMNEEEAAVKFGVSNATVTAWTALGMLDGVYVPGSVYIPITSEINPEKLKREVN